MKQDQRTVGKQERWIVRPDYWKENVYRVWGEDENYHDDTSPGKMDARAQLMEAAPEMRIALEHVLEIAKREGWNDYAVEIERALAKANKVRS